MNAKTDRLAKELVHDRTPYIQDKQDVAWYASELAEYQPLTEQELGEIIAKASDLLGL